MALFSNFNDHINSIRDRVKKYHSINLEDVVNDMQNGESIFLYIAQGNCKVVKSWLYGLDKSITMGLKDKAGWNVMHVAVMLNNLEISNYLIKSSLVDVNIPCNSLSIGLINWRPIHVACEFGHGDILRTLLKANSNAELFTEAVQSELVEPRVVNKSSLVIKNKVFNILDTCVILEGWTPLHLAVIHDRYECVDVLLTEAKVYVDARSTVKRKTALILAGKVGSSKIIERLLYAGANPNCEDSSGKTALYYAAKRGSSAIVEQLLKFGSNPRILTKKYRISPLHASCSSMSLESPSVMCQLLSAAPEVVDWRCDCIVKVAQSLRISSINCFMMSVLAASMSSNDSELRLHLDKIRILLNDHSVDINSVTTVNEVSQMNAFHLIIFALRKCHLSLKSDLVNLLLTYPINVNHINSNNESILFCAVKLNLIGFITFLLQRNADPNICDKNGMSPLMLAVNKRYMDIIVELIQFKADINHEPCSQIFLLDDIQITHCQAIHLALINGDLKTMDLLVKHGADVRSTIRIIESTAIQSNVGLLHLAVLSRHKLVGGLFDYLLGLGLDLESLTSNEETPLLFAARFANVEACRSLLSRGAYKDAANNVFTTALITAAANRNIELMELMLLEQADINKQDVTGYTALHHCFLKNFRSGIDLFLTKLPCQCDSESPFLQSSLCSRCISDMISSRLQVNLCTNEERITLLALALEYGTVGDVKALLDLKADPNCVFVHNDITITPMFLAVEIDSIDNFNNLIEYGCDLMYVSSPNQETILHAALRNKNASIAKNLIFAGMDLNARSIMGQGHEVLPMHVAVQNGLEDIIMILMKFGCSINSTMTLKTVERVSPLHLAALNDLTPTVTLLSKQKLASVHINSTRSDSFNALLTLVSKRNEKGVRSILEAGADVSSRCVVSRSRNATCLHIAAQVGSVEIVRLLLEYGADPSARMMTGERDGILPIHLATESGHLDIVQLFFEWGVSASAAEDCGLTCLHYAANCGRVDITQLLLSAGADVNSEATDGNRSMMLPIHMAAEKGHLEVVTVLLKHGSPINAVFNRGNRDNISSLYIATSENRDNVLNYLILCGADANLQETNLGATPLHIACQRGHMKPLEYLMGIANSDINASLHTGISSLHLTAEKGHDELSFWLLRFKCDPNLKGRITDSYSKKTSYDISPLNQACGFGHLNIVKMLIRSGADICWSEVFEGHEGIKPIHCAAIRGRYHIISTLIETGVNVDELDNKGRTALHWAVIEGFYDCVKVLVDLRADISIVDEDGKTPIDYAKTANIQSLLTPSYFVLS